MQLQASTTENDSVSASVEPQNIWLKLVPKIMSVVNVSAALTIAGFFVIHSYLATLTRLFTYNISVTQYLAAGINLILAILWNFILPVVLAGFALAIIGVGCYQVWRWGVAHSLLLQRLQKTVTSKFASRRKQLVPIIRVSWRIYNIITGLLLFLFILATSFIYGNRYYALSPREVGGGMPAEVILVFKEPQSTKGWPFAINPTIFNQSEKVELLLELTDGLLVRGEINNVPVIVKNDVLQAVIDYAPPVTASVPVGTPTINPTATP